MLKNKLTILRIFGASLLGFILMAYLLLLIPAVQNLLVKKAATQLSQQLGTEVNVGHVSFSLFNRLDIEDVLIKDTHKDTLLFTKNFKLRLSDLFFSKSDPVIRYIGLEGTKIYLNRRTPIWNYQFLVDYLNKDTANKSTSPFDIKKIDISDFNLIQNDLWEGEKRELSTKNILINLRSFNKKNKSI